MGADRSHTRCCSHSCMMQVQPPAGRTTSVGKSVTLDLTNLQVVTNMHELKGVCELRGSWRCMLH
jgi:hypothetical protein